MVAQDCQALVVGLVVEPQWDRAGLRMRSAIWLGLIAHQLQLRAERMRAGVRVASAIISQVHPRWCAKHYKNATISRASYTCVIRHERQTIIDIPESE